VTNKLYYGDNLDVLRDHIATGSVDLIYLDPPFNSNPLAPKLGTC
jgi:site-specific DNA-methyltransferase (adenine-specific)